MAKRSKIARNEVRLRGLAHEGYLPGLRKSSW